MFFLQGRGANTSICTACYLTITPRHGQKLSEAQREHMCGVSDNDKVARQQARNRKRTPSSHLRIPSLWKTERNEDFVVAIYQDCGAATTVPFLNAEFDKWKRKQSLSLRVEIDAPARRQFLSSHKAHIQFHCNNLQMQSNFPKLLHLNQGEISVQQAPAAPKISELSKP
jgi:hypothetical protein